MVSKVTLEKRGGEGTLTLHCLKLEVMMLISSHILLARTSHMTPKLDCKGGWETDLSLCVHEEESK